MSVDEILDAYRKTLKIFPEKSRLEVGGTEFAFHCDKFNTRIIKNIEDTMGIEEGGKILSATAENSTYRFLEKFLNSDGIKQKFSELSPKDKFKVINEMFKFLAYGSVDIQELSENKAILKSKNTYISEGWLENMKKWFWGLRKKPGCHDTKGYLSATLSIIFNKPVGTYKCTETKCRSMGDEYCEFLLEVV